MLVCTTAEVALLLIVRLFKHIQESAKYNRFDTKLLTGKYQLVLNKKTTLPAVYMIGICVVFYALWYRRTVLEVAPQWVLAMR